MSNWAKVFTVYPRSGAGQGDLGFRSTVEKVLGGVLQEGGLCGGYDGVTGWRFSS
jgi:hypothetical protein